MKAGVRKFGVAERGLLPEGRFAGPMPWVIAIMMFLTVLAAATGLGLASAATRLAAQIGGRITIQVVEANPQTRQAQANAAAVAVRGLPGVAAVRVVPDAEIQALLEPWIGAGGLEADLPVPALVDVDMTPGDQSGLERLRLTVAAVAPAARVDDNAQWLAPLAALIGALKWLAAGLVLLMVGATGATVVLAARASLDTHRGTIEILHLMGATDVQVARLFQRRIALDALFGGLVGFILAGGVLILLGDRVAALGSEMLGSAEITPIGWGVLIALPVFGVLLAMLVARLTILRALGRMLLIRALTRIFASGLLIYVLGYALFAVMLPKPAGDERTDAIVVLTGGSGRLERGFDALRRGLAQRMLISGVARTVRPGELAAAYNVDARLFECCISLGREAFDTRSNGDEVARWMARRRYRSLRLVTNDLHMPRARYELRKRIGGDITILVDAVPTSPSFQAIFLEYNKYLLGRAADLIGI